MINVLARAALVVALLTGGAIAVASPASAAAHRYARCADLNRTYKHGVGKRGAKDHVRPHNKPVTNFKVSNALYKANKGLDRDHDGIACEKH